MPIFAVDAAAEAPTTISQQPPQSSATRPEPAELAGLSAASVPEQLERVTRLASDPRWSDGVGTGFMTLILDPSGDPTVRNNIANGLLIQDVADASVLRGLFADVAFDEKCDYYDHIR